MSYNHFTIVDRIKIKSYDLLGMSITAIADQMGVHKSSISRELSRNSIDGVYEPLKADSYAKERRKNCHKKVKATEEIIQHIEERFALTWSPEQIVGRKEEKPENFPATSTIYDWIHKGYLLDGDITKLRRKGKVTKTVRDRKSGKYNIGKSIRKRPKSVYKRETVGDWEGDTVVGKQGTLPCFVTLLERKSRFYLVDFVPNRTAEVVYDSIVKSLSSIPNNIVRTITFDRGKEFAKWRKLEKTLNCKTYFTDPYCSWQKGSNENSNGLLREFFPKGIDLSATQPDDVLRAVNLLNNRPRKCLNYRTPAEVFYEEIIAS